MPVRKFRSVSDMPEPPRRIPGDPALYKAIAGVWAFGRAGNPRRFPPGLHKYRSIEDMNRAQDSQLAAHVEALRHRQQAAMKQPSD